MTNINNEIQITALTNAVVGYAINIDTLENIMSLVEHINNKHCALNIKT
jgi:hemoglobin-like flavoprotein